MMMMLGPVYFSINTAAYEQLQRSTQYQWASQNRLGHPIAKHLGIGGPAYQYIGPGDETINLNGTMYPQYKGGPIQLSMMRLSAGSGLPMPLINGKGFILGRWLIESVQETNSVLFADGTARKIDFSLSLKRYNEDLLLFL
ncbi:hypothetical protein AB835_03840 [Candidatus Endobugula sertula]|uniref:Phage tail protein n=1 Tax=Candidatus Endobugula sertula TaxID=62101 RepID=A0A1D2QSE6_9GAMM|nr:hypothetical protein AB835_03840 [Candidatus Endobugula sertula]